MKERARPIKEGKKEKKEKRGTIDDPAQKKR